MKIKRHQIRNYVGFWLLGLCNNYAYVVMLSAAVYLLKHVYHSDDSTDSKSNNGTDNVCFPTSAGAVLVANILPALLIKVIAPFLIVGTQVKVCIVIGLMASSFVMTAFSNSAAMTFIGIVCASLSSGLGEITFLGYTSVFDSNVISTWSSGTGAAGLIGSFSYAGLTSLGLSPKHTLLLMLIVPIFMGITFWIIIVHPSQKAKDERRAIIATNSSNADVSDVDVKERDVSFKEKLRVLKSLLKYMIPLGLVYFFEYFINQGLLDIIYFKNSFLKRDDQYPWYQVVYQFGVLISRSSVNVFKIKALWLLPILQAINVMLLLAQVLTSFMPSIFLVFAIVLYEGLLGGAAYVNTFYRISTTAVTRHKQFSMSIASLADSMGITVAGFTSIPVHNLLCKYLETK